VTPPSGKGGQPPSSSRGRLVRRIGFTAVVVSSLLVIGAIVEHLLERRDVANLAGDDTYCSLGGRRVRYRLSGADRPGPPIVLASGFGGTIEQWRLVQDRLAADAPALAYDRGGMGFSDPLSSHDVAAEAEELAELLRAIGLAPPIVVASYSSSALMVRTFVERHPELVSGVVLLDPLLPKNEYIGKRPLGMLILESLVGVSRIRELPEIWRHPPTTRAEEKANAFLGSFHHWLAASEESMLLGNWTESLMAMPPPPPVPWGVLCTFEPNAGQRSAEVFDKDKVLAAESPRGIFLPTHLNHSHLLYEEAAIPTVIEFVGRIEREARAPTEAARGASDVR
jgi:pimeloyl-ACP methyl ester carboxylesterase